MPAEFLTTTGFLFEFGRELLVLNSLKIRELKRKGEKSGDRRGIRIGSFPDSSSCGKRQWLDESISVLHLRDNDHFLAEERGRSASPSS